MNETSPKETGKAQSDPGSDKSQGHMGPTLRSQESLCGNGGLEKDKQQK